MQIMIIFKSNLYYCGQFMMNCVQQIDKMKRNARKIQLPKNFAEKLLDCEIQYRLADKPSKQMVKNLIELYTQGVEYYESIRNHKYLYFQLKMNQIFMSASTITAISDPVSEENESPLKKKMMSMKEEEKIEAIQIKQKQEKMFQQITQNTSEKATVMKAKEIINSSDLKTLETKQKVKKQLINQDDILKQKLQKRKSRALLSKSFSSAGVIGEAETKDTLFADYIVNDLKNPNGEINPLQVNFESVINENQSDQEQSQMPAPYRKRSISQDPTKKFKVEEKKFKGK